MRRICCAGTNSADQLEERLAWALDVERGMDVPKLFAGRQRKGRRERFEFVETTQRRFAGRWRTVVEGAARRGADGCRSRCRVPRVGRERGDRGCGARGGVAAQGERSRRDAASARSRARPDGAEAASLLPHDGQAFTVTPSSARGRPDSYASRRSSMLTSI